MWKVYICGINIRWCDSYSDAVKVMRQNYNANARQDHKFKRQGIRFRGLAMWTACITYEGIAP